MDYDKILAEAFAAPAIREQPSGCGRIYVCFTAGPWDATPEQKAEGKKHIRGIAKAAKKMGKIFQGKSYYGASNALYVGYDNHDGGALGKGTAIVAYLQSKGFSCYRDEQAD